jgi:superfamily II DNA/RNA helicase
MKSIYVPENNDKPPYTIALGNETLKIDTYDGRKILGDLAPFWLNPVQSAFFSFYDQKNALISTPTGSGKTVIAFMAAFNINKSSKKTLYIAPTRALARQIFQDIRNKALKVYLRTGESKMDVKDDFDLVVATPEAYLAARHSGSYWTDRVELSIIDEVHMLLQDTRGIVYEETLVQLLGDKKELLLLSATVPDTLSLAKWIDADLLIESSWRPIPLERRFLSIPLPTGKNVKTTIQHMNKEFLEENISGDVKTMIIVPSKKIGWDLLGGFERLGYRAINDTVPYIKPIIEGDPVVAFHNADIPVNEKIEIENAFKTAEKGISVLISTQTLAYGFNSPADDIIIFVKYSMYQEDKIWPVLIDLLQFEGRAGRKGFTKRGIGRVFYSTGATGEKTASILKNLLKKGLEDTFNTTLDKAFVALDELYSHHYSSFHPDNEKRLLGLIELFVLGIVSVDEDKFRYTHYQGRFKERILRKAFDRLLEISMMDIDHRPSPLGRLTASYLLNPESVSQFANNTGAFEQEAESESFLWVLWESIAMLVPGGGAVPAYYPPFSPAIGGNWNRLSVFFKEYSNLLQYGLGFLWYKIGVEQSGKKLEGRRQKPPAWVGSLYYDVDLICSFYQQGAHYGFWPQCPQGFLERIKRSLVYGVSPEYSLLTRIPGIGSIRSCLNSLIADFYKVGSDIEWLQTIIHEKDILKSFWDGFEPYLRALYRVQLEWLKKTLELSGDISIEYLISLDKEAFTESARIFREYFQEEAKSREFIALYAPNPASSPFRTFKNEIAGRYSEMHMFFFVEEDSKTQLMNQVPFRLCDETGNQKVYGTVYPDGRLPNQTILRFQDASQRRIHTDYIDTIWEEGV